MMKKTLRSARVGIVRLVVAALVFGLVSPAWAAPQAHILRIDPRASLVDGAPVLTTVVELVQTKRLSQVTRRCAALTGNAQLNCTADELQKPESLYTPLKWPEGRGNLLVAVDGRDTPSKFVGSERWGASKNKEGVGTAWLILIDAAASMGSRFNEAKDVGKAFVNSMRPHDIVNVMYFNDRAIVEDSGWITKKSSGVSFIDKRTRTFPAQGGTRPLFNIIKQGATDGFRELGNAGSKIEIPMHQAMVVLSNGKSGADASSAASVALGLADYMTKGRFPEDNKTLPKAPVPIISVWFPARELEALFENARQFMENLANTDIGGFHSIVLNGQSSRGPKIVATVRRRFDQMHIIKWRVSCVAPTVGQTFRLVFNSTNPPIGGDNFINVPVGIDPTTWPLDIDLKATVDAAKKDPVHPDGSVKVFGNFCWGSNEKRAQLYMIPKNQQAPPSLKGRSVEEAQNAQKVLIASNMVGKATNAGDTFVEFDVPDTTKFLAGSGSKMSARIVVVDTNTYRTSAITADKILTLRAQKKPLPYALIGGLVFGGVVLILLIIQIFRGGGRRRSRRSSSGPAPAPVVAGGHHRHPGPPGPPGPPGHGGYPPPPR